MGGFLMFYSNVIVELLGRLCGGGSYRQYSWIMLDLVGWVMQPGSSWVAGWLG